MSYNYRTDTEQLTFLTNRIQRLEKTLERLESLGLNSISSAGQSKSFMDQQRVQQDLERATHEYNIINNRVNGNGHNPNFKETIVCNSDRQHY